MYCERTDYADILEKSNLQHGLTAGGKPAILSSVYKSTNLFKHGPNLEFEFTHSNPLDNQREITDLRRRIDRQIELRHTGEKKIFAYHHRSRRGFSEPVRRSLQRGVSLLREKYRAAYFLFFTQKLITPGNGARGFTVEFQDSNQSLLTFLTYDQWGGRNPDLMWARRDNDLLESAFSACALQFGIAKKPQ